MEDLSAIEATRKTGSELFTLGGSPLPMNLLSFWQWSASNLVGNAMRGILAEYIVSSAIGVSNGIRDQWDAYDIATENGIRIEVKSCAYIQSWEQKKHSSIKFGIRPTRGEDLDAKESSQLVARQADVYVFCLLMHRDQNTINPLNLDQWVFYVLPTRILNETAGAQKSISLSSLERLTPLKCKYSNLKKSIIDASLK